MFINIYIYIYTGCKNFFAYNNRYYDLPEYWTFLLEHPLCIMWSRLYITYWLDYILYIHIYIPMLANRSVCKITDMFVRFQKNFILLYEFWENLKINIVWQFVDWLPKCSVRKNRHDKQILSRRNYVNSPKTLIIFPCILSQTLNEKMYIYFKLQREIFLSNY